jgi:hypothetical protein
MVYIVFTIELNVFVCLFVIEVGYEFDSNKLLEYNHMSFGGPPVVVKTEEEANELLKNIQLESAIGNNC